MTNEKTNLKDVLKELDFTSITKQLDEINRTFSALQAWTPPTIPSLQQTLESISVPRIPTLQLPNFEKLFDTSFFDLASHISKAFEPLKEAFDLLDKLKRIGLLPHTSTPTHLIRQQPDISDAQLDQLISQYYQDDWSIISSDIQNEINRYAVDDEAKLTVSEALEAHGKGLYRCTVRLLFPEIERVIRKELHGGSLEHPITSQKKFRQLISDGPVEAGGLEYFLEVLLYNCLQEHLYKEVKTNEEVDSAANNPIPNRHASLHGLVSYSTQKNSLNAIFIADYVFRVLSNIKKQAEITSERKPSHTHKEETME